MHTMPKGHAPRPWPQFVHQYFETIGARPVAMDNGLRVTLTPEQLRTLEGRPASLLEWGLLWGGSPAPENKTLLLAFDVPASSRRDAPAAENDGRDEGFELCTPDSFRGRQIIDAALRLGAVGRLHVYSSERILPPDDKARWRPYMLFHFHIAYVAAALRQRTETIAVDLVTGETVPPETIGDEIVPTPSGKFSAIPPKLTVGDAYERAARRLEDALRKEDARWTESRRAWLAEESERLQSFLRRASLEEEDDHLDAVGQARWAEYERLHPRVDVRIAATTVVYELTPV